MSNEKVIKARKRLFVLVGSLGIIYLIIAVIIGVKKNEEALADDLPVTYNITADDSILFSTKRNKIQVVEVRNSQSRPPISIIRYSEKYHVVTYCFPIVDSIKPLFDLVHIANKNSSPAIMVSYGLIGKEIIYQLRYKFPPSKNIQQIYVSMAGDSIQKVIANDSIVSYHLQCKNLSLKYDEKQAVDLFVEGIEKPLGRTTVFSMDILFLKRNKKIYLFMMTPVDENSSIPPTLLYDIVKAAY